MILAAFALVLSAPTQEPETVVFTDDILNVSFSHPKEWRIAKRDKRSVTFEIPLGAPDDKASLELIRSSFRGDPEIWQTIQLRTNELSKNKVVRQWEQTVLDAPMLFTQAELNAGGRRVTRLTGLFYTSTPLKLLFNLDAPTSKFEDARYAFTRILESLRTIDGSNFKPENPDTPPVTTKPIPVTPRITVGGVERPADPVKLKNETSLSVGPLKTLVRYRDGWTTDSTEPGLGFTSKRITGKVEVSGGTVLDTSPLSVLRTKAGESLASFVKVTRREDREALLNQAGAIVTAVWRRGEKADGPLQTMDAIVVKGDLYAVLHYANTDAKRFDAEQAAVNELLNQITIEPAP